MNTAPVTLDSWLAATIGNPARRAAVRACVDSLDDFRAVELVDLEETIGLARWPVISRRRFVEAWKRLCGAERAPVVAVVTTRDASTQTDASPPPVAAPSVGAPKQRGPSLGPRDERGRFPCPAGCPRTFTHAPAAVQHAKACAGGVRAPSIGTSLKRVPRADFEAWLADRKTRWRAARGYVPPPPPPPPLSVPNCRARPRPQRVFIPGDRVISRANACLGTVITAREGGLPRGDGVVVRLDGPEDLVLTFPPDVGGDRLFGPIGRVAMAGAPPAPAAAPLTDAGRVTPPSKRAPDGPLPPKKRRKHQLVEPRPHLGSITNAASAPEREPTRKAPTVSCDDASPEAAPRKAEPAQPRGPPVSAAEPQPRVTGLNVFAVKWHAKRAADLAEGRAYLVPETNVETAWANLAPGLRAVFEDRARSLNANVG